MLKFKPNVKLDCASPAIMRILWGISLVSREVERDIRIASGNDSEHLPKSKHYINEAIDIGTKEFSEELKNKIFHAIFDDLGPKFTVLFESRGKANEHIHIQVKKGTKYV